LLRKTFIPVATAAVVAAAAIAVMLAVAATATYPGAANGRLAFGITFDGNTDVYSVMPNGKAMRRLTDDPGFDACPAFSADGRVIVWCGPGGVWLMKQNGSEKRQLTSFGSFPDLSPDGETVVFGGPPPGSTNPDIWTINIDGTGLTRLTIAAGQDQFPAWSPDGSRIVFESTRTGVRQVWVMNADGTDQTQMTFDSTSKDQVPDWSPDGSQIAYVTQTASAGGDIWIMDAEGGNRRPITSGADYLGTAWSPDGTRIATLDFPTRTVVVMNVDGTGTYAVHPEGIQFVPAWQPRGVGDGDEN
jgi:Tol biopolymer transport system component